MDPCLYRTNQRDSVFEISIPRSRIISSITFATRQSSSSLFRFYYFLAIRSFTFRRSRIYPDNIDIYRATLLADENWNAGFAASSILVCVYCAINFPTNWSIERENQNETTKQALYPITFRIFVKYLIIEINWRDNFNSIITSQLTPKFFRWMFEFRSTSVQLYDYTYFQIRRIFCSFSSRSFIILLKLYKEEELFVVNCFNS